MMPRASLTTTCNDDNRDNATLDYQTGYDAGYADGHEDGYDTGYDDCNAQYDD